MQLIAAAYLQGCPPDEAQARAQRCEFERVVLGRKCRQVRVRIQRYGVAAGTFADVECENDSGKGVKARATVADVQGENDRHKFPNLPYEQHGECWEWVTDEDECDASRALTGVILGGVLGQGGGSWVEILVDGSPARQWVCQAKIAPNPEPQAAPSGRVA